MHPKITFLHTPPYIIDSRKIIRISGERAWHPLQENETIFFNLYFFNFPQNFRKITFLLTPLL